MDQGTHEAPPPIAWASDALRDVAAERRRQIEVEGWIPEHDDTHDEGELALAASCYAAFQRTKQVPDHHEWTGNARYDDSRLVPVGEVTVPELWPWDGCAWKPSVDRRRMLVKAAALLLAEIERLDRAAG